MRVIRIINTHRNHGPEIEMDDPSPLAFLKLSPGLLTWLACRTFHDALQPLHHLIRLSHILSMAVFFGGITLLDLRLLRGRGAVPFGLLACQVHRMLSVTFAAAVTSGLVLFFYDPIRVGAHGYFIPKMAFLGLALFNVWQLHRNQFGRAGGALPTPFRARVFAAVSLTAWLCVMVSASLNREAAPRVPLW
jgi:hypothetical protein